jgi:predicted amidohydrolase
LRRGHFTLSDNSGETIETDQMLIPVRTTRAGEMIEVDSPLVPAPILLAA